MSPQEDKTARAVATGAELGVRAHAAGHLPLCHPFPEKEGAGQPGPPLRALGKFSFASSAAVVGGLGPFFPVSVTQLSQQNMSATVRTVQTQPWRQSGRHF